MTLVSLQHKSGNAMKAKRDRLKPRSRNLAGACKGVVSGLEKSFDRMGPQASNNFRNVLKRTGGERKFFSSAALVASAFQQHTRIDAGITHTSFLPKTSCDVHKTR